MAAEEDIDALIAEVEKGFESGRRGNSAIDASERKRITKLPSVQSSHFGDDTIDSLLEELDSPKESTQSVYRDTADVPSMMVANNPSGLSVSNGTKSSAFQIAGSSYSFSSGEKTMYHCLSCDLAVICFHDIVWSSKADYMFFRNNYPEENKLKKMFCKKAGMKGYCCQCKWEAVAIDKKPALVLNHEWIHN